MKMGKERGSTTDQSRGNFSVPFQISEWVFELPAGTTA